MGYACYRSPHDARVSHCMSPRQCLGENELEELVGRTNRKIVSWARPFGAMAKRGMLAEEDSFTATSIPGCDKLTEVPNSKLRRRPYIVATTFAATFSAFADAFSNCACSFSARAFAFS